MSIIEDRDLSAHLNILTIWVDPPRALFVDLPLGYPLGAPKNAAVQTPIVMAMLVLLNQRVPPAVRWDFKAGG
jgi:hypothetical protein